MHDRQELPVTAPLAMMRRRPFEMTANLPVGAAIGGILPVTAPLGMLV